MPGGLFRLLSERIRQFLGETLQLDIETRNSRENTLLHIAISMTGWPRQT